ncbi:MAG: LOG family protein [Anaerolineales bacterium]|nr:LOG family protein [Anaerolineales bacterium]
MGDAPILTVFGGSAPQPGSEPYQQAARLGELAAGAGWWVATGGYGGTMEAVSRGASGAGGEVIGVTCDQIENWRDVRPNRWVRREVRCETLRERLYRLIELGDALIALPGGVGTLSEVALSWSLLQTAELSARPLVLVGDRWRRTVDTYGDQASGYLRRDDLELLALVPGVEAAFDMAQAGIEA